VGIVARLVPIKAHHLFLEAAHEVSRTHPKAEFLVVGDGELRGAVEQQARELGFRVVAHDAPTNGGAPAPPMGGPTIRFLGFRSDLARIYADLDLAVLCSLNEGLPVTIIEALAAARPVVASEVGSVADLVEADRTGCLVPPGSASALAAGIRRQLDNREQALEMAARGRTHVYPRLSVDRLEQDLRALYRDLIRS
jgi:glycosyltransferase involved in cell wall biosynthesis